jgi:hypothetical protein
MHLLRSATLVVADAGVAAARYVRWLQYRIVEDGLIEPSLAASWEAPACAGRRSIVLRPASGTEVDLRLIEYEPVEAYRPLRSYGWAALEICVQDTDAVHARILDSPFSVIGPPTLNTDLPTIYPMQVQGPDGEIVFLTEIRGDRETTGLPVAAAPIDRLFIVVIGCRDLASMTAWFTMQLGFDTTDRTSLVYTMLNRSFDLPAQTRHDIATGRYGRDIVFEFDQYPAAAEVRTAHPGALPPGIALCTLVHPAIDTVPGPWLSPPTPRDGAIYGGRRVGVLRTPEGSLLEIVDGKSG